MLVTSQLSAKHENEDRYEDQDAEPDEQQDYDQDTERHDEHIGQDANQDDVGDEYDTGASIVDTVSWITRVGNPLCEMVRRRSQGMTELLDRDGEKRGQVSDGTERSQTCNT